MTGLYSCNEPITDFGFDGHISGIVTDNSGNPVSGYPKLATYSDHALGELDNVPMVMRILGDRTYANTKLYPQSYKVTLRGPGSGMGYSSVNRTVTENSGTATITGLQPNTRYFVRVGARTAGQNLFNLSEQIVFTTAAN